MMSMKTCAAAIIMVCLCMVAAYPQSGSRKRSSQPRHLYQVSTRENQTYRKKIGFIDNTGKLVIGFERLPKTTVAVGDFHDGRARIFLGKFVVDEPNANIDATVGFIDETGTVIIAPRFETARDFSEGLAYVEAKDFKGFIDRSGKVVIRAPYLFTKDFHEGLAAVGMSGRQPTNNDWGYIDRSGKLVIKQQYSFADDFSEGLAGVEVDGKYGFIDRKGKMVIPPRFDLRREERHPNQTVSSGRFAEGLACVRLGGLIGYINHQGDFVIGPQFSRAQDFAEGLAWVVTTGNSGVVNKVGWIDKSGRWRVTEVDGYSFSGYPQFVSYANHRQDWRYSDGLAPFFIYSGDKTLRGYMNHSGQAVIQPREFERVGPFVGGVASVVFHGNSAFVENYGYINKKGGFIWRSR